MLWAKLRTEAWFDKIDFFEVHLLMQIFFSSQMSKYDTATVISQCILSINVTYYLSNPVLSSHIMLMCQLALLPRTTFQVRSHRAKANIKAKKIKEQL